MKLNVKKDATLLSYLYENLDMPKKRIKQYLAHGSIYVSQNRTTQYDYPLKKGMTLFIDTDARNKSEFPFEIIFEDEHILVINKPSGLLTIATEKEKNKTLYHLVSCYLKSKNSFAKVFIVHRLDKDTSGIVLFAKDEKTKNLLQANWNQYVSLREYTAIVLGHPKKKQGRIIQYLRETKTNLVYVAKDKEGKRAVTNYSVLRENNQYSELSITLESGRKNQIRLALSSQNTPILGDKKYGSPKDSENRLYLHANRLKLFYPYLKKEILFETSIPKEFKKKMDLKN